jgi:translation initiation factor 1
MNDNFRPVYSSEHGRLCPTCLEPKARCRCGETSEAAGGDGPVRVRRETKGRGGKTVTVVTGLPLAGTALKALAKELKRRCGSGGTFRDGTLEIQGDHAELLVAELNRRGFAAKRAGG